MSYRNLNSNPGMSDNAPPKNAAHTIIDTRLVCPADQPVMAINVDHPENVIGSPIEEDFKIWQHSGLGQRILQNDIKDVEALGLTKQQINTLKKILQINGQD